MIKNNNLNTVKSENFSWSLVQSEMKNKLGSDIYESWLKKIDLVEEFNNYILLSVPTRFIRDWITSRYLDQILQIVKTYKKEIIRIELKIVEQSSNNFEDVSNPMPSEKNNNISFISNNLRFNMFISFRMFLNT